MFLHQDNRFIHSGISFKLPNNMYLDPNPETVSGNKLELLSTDQMFRLKLSFDRPRQDAPTFLKDAYGIFEESEVEVIVPVHELQLGGLTAYHTQYVTRYQSMYHGLKVALYDEYVVVSPDPEAPVFFSFYFHVEGDQESEDFTRVRAELLASIEPA